ncbi:heme ABC transporter ATP-binding protein [Halopseudomonas salina]|uniref:Hemin import ATP-binding protein HmuV n=1 Tax=Halopseudomonas salina TaxID=1323744 RepID=A0ABQ1Q0E2_9GAMM|nr:heme ABC transporter ATP-binding protein [Halopseudomonas salina]GGD08122.1 hemin import ATP-binding protein HmuV [Halopseudomonas salina]
MLAVRGLSCARGGCQVVAGIDFRLQAGEVLAVLGTNGAGKSTLLATLSGELPRAAGDILLADRPLESWAANQRAQRLAVLPQASSLAFAFSVEEVVLLGRLPHASGRDEDARIAAEVMHAADITHLRQRSYLALSGGERQRVHLARVLAQIWSNAEPACLLLDEPTASLDLAHQRLILQQARELAGRGNAVLLVLHDLNLAARYADRLLLLDRGGVSAVGTPWDVLKAERISQVFGVEVQVAPHPQLDCPLIIS